MKKKPATPAAKAKTAKKRAAAKKFKETRKEWRAAKGTAPKRDELRRNFCHQLKCVACSRLNENRGLSECAHVGDRGLGQKSSDFETIALCKMHHTEGPCANHKLGKRFWDWLGISKEDAVAKTNRQYEKWLRDRGSID